MIPLEKIEVLSWSCDDAEGWAALSEALLLGIACCESLVDMLAVMECGGIAELTYREGGLEAVHLEAILARASTWTCPSDVAGAVGLAVRATAYEPGALLVRDEAVRGDKPHLLAALDRQLERFRRMAGDEAPVRAAAAHALAHCSSAATEDVRRLVAAMEGEADDEALASHLLAAAAVAWRHGAGLATASFERRLDHPSQLVRVCAAAALAHERPLRPRETAILAEALVAPTPLPIGWGWRWPGREEKSDAVAVRVLSWAESEAPATAVKALASLDGETRHESEALFRMALARIPPHGIALEQLDDLQRVAVAAFARPGFASRRDLLRRLGFPLPEDVKDFLEAATTLWRVRRVDTAGGSERWHMGRIWREHVAGTLDRARALSALLVGQPGGDLVEAICHPRHGPLLVGGATGPEAAERDRLLTWAVLRRLRADGFDLAAQCRRMLASGEQWHAVSWAIALLTAASSPLPEWEEAIAFGLGAARAAAPFGDLLARLPEERRDAILALARTTPP